MLFDDILLLAKIKKQPKKVRDLRCILFHLQKMLRQILLLIFCGISTKVFVAIMQGIFVVYTNFLNVHIRISALSRSNSVAPAWTTVLSECLIFLSENHIRILFIRDAVGLIQHFRTEIPIWLAINEAPG